MKRAGVLAGILGVFAYTFYAVGHSGWFNEKEARTLTSFHEKMADSGFRVHNLLIDGRQFTTREDLKSLLNIQKNSSIFSYDLTEIQQKISTLPWVKFAVVERRLPDTIYVKLTERQPIALWQREGKVALVDAEGKILTDKNLDQFTGMIVITGDNAPQNASELVGTLQAEPDLLARLDIARWIGNRRWDLCLKNGITIRLPEEDAGLAIKKLVQAQASDKVMDRQIEAIDLRDSNRLVVQTAPGAVEKYEAGYHKGKNI